VARALAVLLLLPAAGVPSAHADDALAVIDECVAKLDPELDVGYARVAARCPDLTAVLTESPWMAWLPADWNRPDNQLSARGLSELRTLLARAGAPAVSRRPPPRPERLSAALAEVTRGEPAGTSWWQRLRDWLHAIMTTRAPTDNRWLVRWLEHIKLSSSAAQLIVWGALIVVIALAVGIVLNELRLAGLLGARGRRPGARTLQRDGRSQGLALAQVDQAALERQPGLLLELIAQTLAAQARLPPARALTARELEQRARLPDESVRPHLAELVRVSECVRFSAGQVSAASLTAASRSGRVLLAALAPPAVGVPTVP
jgi:hypothetical protein